MGQGRHARAERGGHRCDHGFADTDRAARGAGRAYGLLVIVTVAALLLWKIAPLTTMLAGSCAGIVSRLPLARRLKELV